jgi:hypothetical protein
MGTVLIHAGMPKTGSTSIQTWLRTNAGFLRENDRITIVREAPAVPGEPVRFEPFSSGISVNSIAFLLRYHAGTLSGAGAGDLTALTEGFVEGLDRAAAEMGTILLSGEAYASLFALGDEPFLGSLERLAHVHTVRVAYYVRPQHTALEARWRQWGFQSELSPSAWVLDQSTHLRYAETVEHVSRLAPSVSFEVRPFRSDLLESGNVVIDFARQFLRVDDPPGALGIDENPGPSLDLANLLRGAPQTLLEDARGLVDTGWRQQLLARLGRSWNITESAAAAASREVLHRYAYAAFEARNRTVVEALGWPTPCFVPQPEAPAAPGSAGRELADLDELWEPRAAATARAYLHAALAELMADRAATGGAQAR